MQGTRSQMRDPISQTPQIRESISQTPRRAPPKPVSQTPRQSLPSRSQTPRTSRSRAEVLTARSKTFHGDMERPLSRAIGRYTYSSFHLKLRALLLTRLMIVTKITTQEKNFLHSTRTSKCYGSVWMCFS